MSWHRHEEAIRLFLAEHPFPENYGVKNWGHRKGAWWRRFAKAFPELDSHELTEAWEVLTYRVLYLRNERRQ